MNGTAATMGIEENLALALRRGNLRTLKPGINNNERKLYRDLLLRLGLGLEDRLTSFRRTETGSDTADVYFEAPKAAFVR